jgi:hypothetical protein
MYDSGTWSKWEWCLSFACAVNHISFSWLLHCLGLHKQILVPEVYTESTAYQGWP